MVGRGNTTVSTPGRPTVSVVWKPRTDGRGGTGLGGRVGGRGGEVGAVVGGVGKAGVAEGVGEAVGRRVGGIVVVLPEEVLEGERREVLG